MGTTLPPAQPLLLDGLVTPTEKGIASRVLARSGNANVTLFAFDAGEELAEHSTPYDALALTLRGGLTLTIGGKQVEATAGTIVRMPANVPHAVRAVQPSRMLLIMLRDPVTA